MPNTKSNAYGKHPVYLNVDHDLFVALNMYAQKMGVPRSRIIFSILRGFLAPLSDGLLNEGDTD